VCALTVEVPEFSGPLDLLLNLILKRRLDVTTVSLAVVADQYLEQVRALDGDLESLSEFLLVASQLVLIKSRALLPVYGGLEPELDPAEELRRRLAEYQVLQAAARWLGDREGEGLRSWPRGGELPAADADGVLAPLAPAGLARILAARLRRRPTAEPAQTLAAQTRPTLQARAEILFAALGGGGWVSLDAFLGSDVPTAVATFLALLALVRRGLVVVRQADWNASLEVRRQSAAPQALGDLGALD
jgi:segregation and condensation protein A